MSSEPGLVLACQIAGSIFGWTHLSSLSWSTQALHTNLASGLPKLTIKGMSSTSALKNVHHSVPATDILLAVGESSMV
jgi:hypothetical protein